MNCRIEDRETAELVLEYFSRTLDPATAALLEKHVETCVGCRRLMEGQRATWNALDSWRPEMVSQDFNARLYGKIASERRPAWWRQWLPVAPFSWKPALPLAVAAVMVLAAVLVRIPQGPDVQPKAQNTIDIEQVEQALEELELLMPVRPPGSANTI
jgi:hypothetical protein